MLWFTANFLRYLSHKYKLMAKASFNSGRINQKVRTRNSILQAARTLLQEKGDYSLEEVAEYALISRATVYRYFSDVDTLKLEAAIDDGILDVDNVFGTNEESDIHERVGRAGQRLFELASNKEPQMRSLLSVVLKHSVSDPKEAKERRGSRRVVLFKTAIEPYLHSIPKKKRSKLVHTLAVLFGIESLVVLKDVCELDNQEALETIQWATDILLKEVLNND